MIQGEPAGWDDTVNMRMMQQVLSPGVQHTQESDLCSKVLRIACDFEKRLGAGVEKQSIQGRWVAKRERREFLGQRENDVEVADRQKLPLTRGQPFIARASLALRAMPVAA